MGRDVPDFAPDNRVWGVLSREFGAAAEFVVVPAGLYLVEAAALSGLSTTVIAALRDKAGLRAGERLLLRGASGDVVLDTVGTRLRAYRRLLTRSGRMVTVSFDLDHMVTSLGYLLASTVYARRRVRFFRGTRTPACSRS